jgi:lipid II:glycine glycyltransferase (peptidoglycan interpeptide bridge formation enzyme)
LEILAKDLYGEYEDFVRAHPSGSVMQSVLWHRVKDNWRPEIVVVRNDEGAIIAGVSVLVRRIPVIGTSMLYAPRGPVCDLYDADIMSKIKQGVDMVAKKYRAHIYKIDPDVLNADEAFVSRAVAAGYKRYIGGTGFETIQPRFNYRLYLDGRDEDALFMNLASKTRYNVRVARKHGVEVRIGGREDLDEFVRLMVVTGARDGFSVRPRAYFERMLEALGEHVRLYMAYYQGKAVSGAITTNYAGKACYIYGASDNEHRNVMPNYLIQWEMIRWAIETNCTVYDFQGVSGNFADENDPLYGLYRFKRGFGGQVDELAGEFDYIYMPLRNKLVDVMVDLVERLRALKRKLRR